MARKRKRYINPDEEDEKEQDEERFRCFLEGERVCLIDAPNQIGEIIFESSVSRGLYWIAWTGGKLDFEEGAKLKLAE